MQTYSVLLEFARKFASQARVTTDREVARELWRMAIEYQDKAAALDNGKFPEFRYVIGWRLLGQGTPFEWLKSRAATTTHRTRSTTVIAKIASPTQKPIRSPAQRNAN